MIKYSESEFHTQGTHDIVCPYCGETHQAEHEDYGDQDEELEMDCSTCEKSFIYTTDYDVTFYSGKKEK